MANDPLLDQIARLKKEQAEKDFQNRKKASESIGSRVADNVTVIQKTFHGILGIVDVAWRKILRPALGVVEKIVVPVFHWFKNQWDGYVYQNDEFGNPRFKLYRAGIFLGGMITSWFVFIILLTLTYYTLLFAFTHKTDEVVYMTNSHEVNSDEDIFSAQGCDALPCDQETSIYFRIEPTMFNHLYNIATSGSAFYSDHVAAAIPPTITKCTITSYGIRFKFLMRWSNIYPYLLRASCSPVLNETTNN